MFAFPRSVFVVADQANGTLFQAFRRIGDQAVGIRLPFDAQPLTVRACAVRRIERKRVRLRFGVGDAGGRTHEILAVVHGASVFRVVNHERSFTLFEGGTDTGFQAFFRFFGRRDPVYDQFDVVYLVAIQVHAERQVGQFAVHTHFEKTLLAHGFKQLAVVAFAAVHQGRENQDVVSRILFSQQLQNLVFGIFDHLLAGHVRISFAYACVQQAEEIVDFGNRADGGARVLVRRFLLYRDNGAEAVYFVHVRPLQVAYELAGVGRKRFHIASLPLGINRVEGQ